MPNIANALIKTFVLTVVLALNFNKFNGHRREKFVFAWAIFLKALGKI